MLKISISLFLFIAAFLSINSYAQYSSPESVTYDSVTKRYFISNTSSGKVLQRSQAGVVTDFVTPGGTLRGLTIYNGVLYAATSNSVKGYDLNTGTPGMNLSMGTSLNGIDADTNGYLYVSNFTSAGTIYKIRISDNQFWAFATVPRTPNGVYADYKRNRLLVVAWGGSATVISVNLTDSTDVTTLVTTPYSNLDGISLDRNDHVYCSSYSSNLVFRYDINFASSPAVVVNTGLSSPADIYVNRITDTLAVPNAGNNTVSFIPLTVPTTIQHTNNIADGYFLKQNYPNPFNPSTNISFEIKEKGLVTLKVYDILGNEMASLVNEELNSGSYNVTFDASNFTSGVYFYELKSGSYRDTKKMLLVK